MSVYSNLLNRADLEAFLNDEHLEFRDQVHRFLERHASPQYLRECDENKQFPQELVRKIGEQGWFALTLPEEYGGVGGYLDMVSLLEVIGYHSASLGRFWNINVNMVGGALALLGSDEIRQSMLPRLAEGKVFFAFGLSENGSGSDAASLRTSAIEQGDDFVINGTKMWISGAIQASYIMAACRTGKEEGKHDGISLILIPADDPGVTINPIDLLGGHMIRTCEINLVDVLVPKAMLVGELHRGWSRLLGVLSKERIALSAICIGAAQAVVNQALSYAKERHQFGKPISAFQAVNHKLVEMQTLVDASRLLMLRAARLLDKGLPCGRESSEAKFFAADAYMRIAMEGIQIMGANGYSMEYAMQRHFREAKMFQIFGGTNEIQRNIIARELLSQD